MSPKDDPEMQFFAFNTVESESFGVPGFANGLKDTYELDIFREAFETRADDADVDYSFDYVYPIKSSSVYYSDLNVDIEPVSPENLDTVQGARVAGGRNLSFYAIKLYFPTIRLFYQFNSQISKCIALCTVFIL